MKLGKGIAHILVLSSLGGEQGGPAHRPAALYASRTLQVYTRAHSFFFKYLTRNKQYTTIFKRAMTVIVQERGKRKRASY